MKHEQELATGDLAPGYRHWTDADARALWAVRVLDAWAERHEVMAPAPCFHHFTSRVDGAPLPRWRIFHGLRAVGGHEKHFSTADAARIAAAELIVSEDPSLGS